MDRDIWGEPIDDSSAADTQPNNVDGLMTSLSHYPTLLEGNTDVVSVVANIVELTNEDDYLKRHNPELAMAIQYLAATTLLSVVKPSPAEDQKSEDKIPDTAKDAAREKRVPLYIKLMLAAFATICVCYLCWQIVTKVL